MGEPVPPRIFKGKHTNRNSLLFFPHNYSYLSTIAYLSELFFSELSFFPLLRIAF